ncbi:MAG: efflux RND transporter periplasmic adaptor subunit [Gammaproteobacteria bacterium]|nr:efflux RND transporter periplasmic adaptor subunit [Gammaproteobacteria bacterium]
MKSAGICLPALLLMANLLVADELDFTLWENELEAFVEHDSLQAGQPADFAVHLTWLATQQAVTAGALTLTLQAPGQEPVRRTLRAPDRPGIYLAQLVPRHEGRHMLELALEHDGRSLVLRHDLTVHSSAGARHDHDHDHDAADSAIAFSKERQWRMAFSVDTARIESIAARISAAAMVEAMPGRQVDIVAPARGTLRVAADRPWLRPGQEVNAGETLAELASLAGADDLGQLRAEQLAAEARWRMAREDLQRVTGLAADGVVSERRLSEAQTEEITARGALEAANARLGEARGGSGSGDALLLRSPIRGTVIAAPRSPGAMVEAGTSLATVLDAEEVWIRVSLLAHDLVALTDPQDLAIRRPGDREWRHPDSARLVYRGLALEDGILPLVFEVANDGSLPPGLPLVASLAAGAPQRSVTIPETALLSDDGVDVVIVQLGGERFERRPVRTRTRAAGRVAVGLGLEAGERVVVDGAYAVLLAGRTSAAGDDDHHHHGHSH